jgi:hypothetical protein
MPQTTSDLLRIAKELGVFPDTFAKDNERAQQIIFARRVLSPAVDRPVGRWVVRRSGSGSASLYRLDETSMGASHA